MKKTGLIVAVMLFCFAAAHFMSGQAFAQTSSSTNAESAAVFGGIVVHQAGSNLLLIEIKGVNLPAPKITTSDSGHMVFFFEGASVPAERWTRSYSFPLLNGVEVINVEGGLEMRLFTTQLLEVKEMTGTPPAPLYRLQLRVPGQEVSELPKKEENPFPLALQTGPKDPMSITSPVTLELRDTELKDLLRLLAKFMKLNVIIDPSVPPNTVTLSVKDAPLREVLSYVMRMNNLKYAMMGNTILFGTPENLGKSLGMEQTKSYKIAYAARYPSEPCRDNQRSCGREASDGVRDGKARQFEGR